jgi:hypothetical protein
MDRKDFAMTRKKKQTSVTFQCAKCRQTDPKVRYRELFLTDTRGDQTSCVTLCSVCLHMFWRVYDGFIQTRSTPKLTFTRPPTGFRAALPYHRDRHVEAIEELKKEITWHRQTIRYLQEIPSGLSAPHPHP